MRPFFERSELIFDRISEPLLPGTAVMIDQKVTAQPRQPRDERAFRRAVTLERPKHAQENVLRQILRLGVAPGEAVAQPVDPARVQPDQFLPTGRITAQAPFDKREVKIQAGFPAAASREYAAPRATRIRSAGRRKHSSHGSGCHSLPRNTLSSPFGRFFERRPDLPAVYASKHKLRGSMMIGSFFRSGAGVSMAPEEGGLIRKSRWKWLALGALLLLGALYLLRSELRKSGFRWPVFVATLTRLDWPWLLAATGLAPATYYVRAPRWAVLLKPVQPYPNIGRLISATAIGFTAITLLGRPGEFVRPYLISVQERVPFSSQISAWVLERIYDLLISLAIFGFALSHIPELG